MVNKTELYQTRKDLANANVPVILIAEALYNINWLAKDDLTGIKSGYNRDDLENAILKEVLSIWKNKTFNANNIKNLLNEKSNAYDTDNILNRIKAGQINADWYKTGDRNNDFLKWWTDELPKWSGTFWTTNPDVVKTWYDKLLAYWGNNLSQQFPGGLGDDTLEAAKKKLDQLQTDLNTAQPFAKKYEDLAIYWKDNLRTDLNNTPFHPDGLKEVKKTLDQLKADKTQLEKDKTDLTTERDNLKTSNTEKDNAINSLNSKITNLQQAVNNNQGTSEQVNNLNQQLSSKDTQITSLTSELDQAKKEGVDKDSIIHEQESTITERDKTIEKQEKELTKKIDTISELDKKNQDLKAQIQALKEQLNLQAVQVAEVSDK